ncbi:UNVERIFIED_CONTAM: hypothetical protein GTU68_029666 [Idotea baltica]|nr:hypothetical protein [Idotea baltica]
MRILIASDKFKGSLSAVDANRAIAKGLKDGAGRVLEINSTSIADGGDGLVQTLVSATGGTTDHIEVTGPLGSPTKAVIGYLPDEKTAVIEMAEASGIALLKGAKLNPEIASTFGTGEMILKVCEKGVSRIIMGLGGSATNDGGVGMALALGFQFLDSKSNPLVNLPRDLLKVSSIKPPEDLSLPEIIIACDVTNPLLGPNGCTKIYGPQKGVTRWKRRRHEKRLSHLTSLFGGAGKIAANTPGAGAAGGLGFGSLIFLKGRLTPGFDLVADILDLENAVKTADFVITGEGKLDDQSLLGKGPGGVAHMARRFNKPVIAFCGIADLSGETQLFDEIIDIRPPFSTHEDNMREASRILTDAAKKYAEENLSDN